MNPEKSPVKVDDAKSSCTSAARRSPAGHLLWGHPTKYEQTNR